MGIEEVFDVGDVPYRVESYGALRPCEVIRQRMGDWLNNNDAERAPIWVYYKKKGFFGTLNVQDGVSKNEDGSLRISRFVNGQWKKNIKSLPLEKYLEGVTIAYVQLRAYDAICFGVEAIPDGAVIGHYDFSVAF